METIRKQGKTPKTEFGFWLDQINPAERKDLIKKIHDAVLYHVLNPSTRRSRFNNWRYKDKGNPGHFEQQIIFDICIFFDCKLSEITQLFPKHKTKKQDDEQQEPEQLAETA